MKIIVRMFFFNKNNLHIFGHNEDDDAENCKLSFMIVASFYANDDWNKLQMGVHVDSDIIITSYVNPGFLLGSTFGFNNYGLAFSGNELGPNDITLGGRGNYFILRDVYSSKSFEMVKSATYVRKRALGFSINVGDLNTKKLYNIEYTNSLIDVLEVIGNYSHQNIYRHLECDQDTDDSSVHRLKRINQMKLQSLRDIATILGDHNDTEYPIYRDGKKPDGYFTCATSLFDLDNEVAKVYQGNPSENFNNPAFTFRLSSIF